MCEQSVCPLQDYALASQTAGTTAVQTATHPPPPADRAAEAAAQQFLAEEEREAAKAAARAAAAEAAAQQLLAEEEREAARAAAKAAAAEAAAQQLLAEEEREAAKAAAKKSKKQKQKVKKQLRQQQQQQEEEEASTATPEDAGSPTTSDHEQLSNGLEAAVTAGDGTLAEAGGFSPATPDASSQAPSGSDRHIHHPHTLVSDSEAMCSVPNRSLHDLPTADSHKASESGYG